MKHFRHYLIALVTLSAINCGWSQEDSKHSPSLVVQSMTDAMHEFDSVSYKAQMRFKEFGGDTFEVRDFRISYRKNTGNTLYGYDWEISEDQKSGSTFTFMIVQDGLYVVNSESKAIGYRTLLKRPGPGSYYEGMRSYFILDEVLAPFALVSYNEIDLVDSNNCLSLTRRMNDMATLQLIVNKETYLPMKSISTILSDEFDLAQIMEIEFYIDEHSRLADTAFLPDYYISNGYTFKIAEEESAPDKESVLFSPESQKLLVSYPFISETGNTVFLSEIESRYILLDFWYASCLPCLKALPEVNQLAEAYTDTILQVIGINCFDMGIRTNLISKLREKDIHIPLLFGTRDLINALGIRSFPSYVLITPERQVELIKGGVDEVRNVLARVVAKE